MSSAIAASAKTGDRIKLTYESREFDVIVIEPNGLGKDQPTVGFGFRMMEKYAGVPESTIRSWVRDKTGVNLLELPSGKVFRVREISGTDGNFYNVIEASDWFDFAMDVIINPGRTGKSVREKLATFVKWFAVKGFYAEAYVVLKGKYSDRDSRATTAWLEARTSGIIARKAYTDLLNSHHCDASDYATWTNYVYEGLFGMTAAQMKEQWKLVEGSSQIARNYVPEAKALEALKYLEDMVVRCYVDNLKESHDLAIGLTKRKFAF